MMTSTDNIHALSGAYALDALDDFERARFEQHLDDCETCTEEVASFLDTAVMLGAVGEHPVNDELRERVLDNTEHVRQVGPVTTRVTRWAPRLASVAAAVLAVAVVGLSVVVAGLRGEVGDLEGASQLASIVQADDSVILTEEVDGGQVRVVASPSSDAGAVLADGLPQAPDGHAYQLWLVDESGEPTSAGFLGVEDDGRAEQLLEGDVGAASAVGVSVEPQGGSETPTTEPIAVLSLDA